MNNTYERFNFFRLYSKAGCVTFPGEGSLTVFIFIFDQIHEASPAVVIGLIIVFFFFYRHRCFRTQFISLSFKK